MEKVRSSSFDRKPEDLPLCLEALIYLAVELAAGFFALMKTALRVLPQRFFVPAIWAAAIGRAYERR